MHKAARRQVAQRLRDKAAMLIGVQLAELLHGGGNGLLRGTLQRQARVTHRRQLFNA